MRSARLQRRRRNPTPFNQVVENSWQLCERTGRHDNNTYLNLVAWCWDLDEARYLVVVNLSEYRSQAHIQLPWDNLTGRAWHLTDVLSGDTFEREGDEMHLTGLSVDLSAWKFRFLRF